MSWRFYGLAILCAATVTACTAQPPMRDAMTIQHGQNPQSAVKISSGACDSVGQYTSGSPLGTGLTLEASAGPVP